MSSLPLGINQIKIQRSLTTSNVAVFVPFVTQELFQSGAAMYLSLIHILPGAHRRGDRARGY